jgi:hypothetical protein
MTAAIRVFKIWEGNVRADWQIRWALFMEKTALMTSHVSFLASLIFCLGTQTGIATFLIWFCRSKRLFLDTLN